MNPIPQHTQPCPVCEGGQRHNPVQDVSITGRGLTAVAPAAAGWFSDVCAKIDLDERTNSGERYAQTGDAMVHQAREVLKQGLVLKAQRVKPKISQAQASEIAGGGHNADSRYETDVVQPGWPTCCICLRCWSAIPNFWMKRASCLKPAKRKQ